MVEAITVSLNMLQSIHLKMVVYGNNNDKTMPDITTTTTTVMMMVMMVSACVAYNGNTFISELSTSF